MIFSLCFDRENEYLIVGLTTTIIYAIVIDGIELKKMYNNK